MLCTVANGSSAGPDHGLGSESADVETEPLEVGHPHCGSLLGLFVYRKSLIAETGPGGRSAACWLLGSTQPRPAHRACGRSRIKADSDSPSHGTMSLFSHRGTCYRTRRPKRNRVTPHYLQATAGIVQSRFWTFQKREASFPDLNDKISGIPGRFPDVWPGTRNGKSKSRFGGDGGLPVEIPEIPVRPGSRE